jgi:hypothetical protein
MREGQGGSSHLGGGEIGRRGVDPEDLGRLFAGQDGVCERPVPQPTSHHDAAGGADGSHRRNRGATSRLQRLTYGS